MRRYNTNIDETNIRMMVSDPQEKHLPDQAVPQTPQEINDFIHTNEWIVRDVIRPYHGLQEDEDLFQEACIGMVKGISTFNPCKGVKLTTYVYACASNEVKMSIRKNYAKKRSATVLSIETYVSARSEKGSKPLDLPDPKVDVEYTACNNTLYRKIMEIVNTKLTTSEQTTIFNFIEGIPQTETAKTLHTSQGQISKLYNQAIRKIRKEINLNNC